MCTRFLISQLYPKADIHKNDLSIYNYKSVHIDNKQEYESFVIL